jgi:hypothetical protein
VTADPTARLVLGAITDAALSAHSRQWVPCLQGEDDEAWDWAAFARGERTEYGHGTNEFVEHFTLWQDDILQALMVISGPHVCQAEENFGLTAVYVAYIAIAPWNRPAVRERGVCLERPAVRPLGRRLMTQAIRSSLDRGLAGCIAWHSVQRAEEAYQQMFLSICGEAPKAPGRDRETGELLMEITPRIALTWMTAAAADQG